ncbi:MAG: hypothetical protein J4400_01340 [Candidatus Aenigmarchaeota archaeon]|nr:hypothetical protein [Candidatus Aenigmarchaeota archaeon]
MVGILQFDNLGRYDACWFEIVTNRQKMLIRDEGEFFRKSEALSHIQEITMYRIEKTVSGFRKSRIHSI